eukprot:4554721-Prymnesium_polylepis.1
MPRAGARPRRGRPARAQAPEGSVRCPRPRRAQSLPARPRQLGTAPWDQVVLERIARRMRVP